jgi:hypothetical protein
MALFVGGPYDGFDLPVDPTLSRQVRLPPKDEIDDFVKARQKDPGATGKHHWPYLYELDSSTSPPCYRFVANVVVD